MWLLVPVLVLRASCLLTVKWLCSDGERLLARVLGAGCAYDRDKLPGGGSLVLAGYAWGGTGCWCWCYKLGFPAACQQVLGFSLLSKSILVQLFHPGSSNNLFSTTVHTDFLVRRARPCNPSNDLWKKLAKSHGCSAHIMDEMIAILRILKPGFLALLSALPSKHTPQLAKMTQSKHLRASIYSRDSEAKDPK